MAGTTKGYFSLTPKGGRWRYKVIYDFCCGQGGPQGQLIVDNSGNLYGIAGGVFELIERRGSWNYKSLAPGSSTFGLAYAGAQNGTPYDGSSPLYLSTAMGGAQNVGAILKVVPAKKAWRLSTLYSFCSQANCADGETPSTRLVVDGTGQVFGGTHGGGLGGSTGGLGVVFRIDGPDSETVLYNLCEQERCGDGGFPTDLTADPVSGRLYGTSDYGNPSGVLFSLAPKPARPDFQDVYGFCSQLVNKKGRSYCADGYYPRGVTVHANALYGIALGGKFNGGVLYSYNGALNKLHLFCSLSNCADGWNTNTNPSAPVVVDDARNVFGVTNDTVLEYSP